ncbi:hypothetical protein WJX72_000848 [[Myrmecia] bisecta]|uniref:Peptidase S54 rhomboid domain-containing protein n=1 Tax=[Myrmecia] bisecta TaxID=41462 RepID=A0AAW1QE21_9CHLO
MGTPIWTQVLQQPATSTVIALCSAIWLYLNNRGIGYSEVGLSYERVVQHRELWRIVTSQLSHVEWLHLAFNMSSLWNLGVVEVAGLLGQSGTMYYAKTSLVLLLGSGLVCLAIYHLLIFLFRQEQYLRATAVGYSCVVFGWMTIFAASGVSTFSLFGMVELPMSLTPFGSLILTSIIIPRASFIGHLSGILVGYCTAFGAFDWLTPFWFCSLLVWAAAGMLWSLVRSGHLRLPFLHVSPEGDVETGSAVR